MPTVVHRFARFAVVGVIATVTHTSVFAACIELARIEDSFVVDRKTALTNAAETTSVTDLGERLAVRYVC
jgi:putative flippase GtrA